MRAIEAENLARIYGRGENRVEALADVSLVVERGEWVGPSVSQTAKGSDSLEELPKSI